MKIGQYFRSSCGNDFGACFLLDHSTFMHTVGQHNTET